ncbi:hypothetical protein K457DRAFT_426868 [Linnemannia elongata AG-77]|uniref:Uncharacterized protein n=1 Tax=Linnemannia elongata AG-77 TaxID=1314771 RepID=A0A197K2A5_9FUNG|nr:hypothetical protein K457DRAFT_426868 [Linnemannia elongata AG-77]
MTTKKNKKVFGVSFSFLLSFSFLFPIHSRASRREVPVSSIGSQSLSSADSGLFDVVPAPSPSDQEVASVNCVSCCRSFLGVDKDPRQPKTLFYYLEAMTPPCLPFIMFRNPPPSLRKAPDVRAVLFGQEGG